MRVLAIIVWCKVFRRKRCPFCHSERYGDCIDLGCLMVDK